jgi:DNA-binding response OmpR family regulator
MTGQPKILIIEDETSVAMMMVFLLTRAGCEVQSAWNAERAEQLAATGDFDLITLDISLPGGGGFEICKRLKQLPHLKHTPVVFVSGCASINNRQRAFELGAVDFIEKPFGASDFVSRVLSLIEETAKV